ncbi:protein rhiA [Roseibium sp.]|uniref:protein rhiA n=1 Tax=Roseibium sp. TaxID=1936156 RepID=UPI003D0B8225
MGNVYTLTFINNSNNNWDFCCYQEDPNISTQDVMSLAWFAFPVAPTTSVSFSWTINYQFVWSQTGKLGAGVKFSASQKWDASLTGNNGVDFTRKPNQAFTFENQAPFGDPGTLYINQDDTIPSNTAAVGINMGIEGAPPGAGTGTFVVPAQPNITAAFTPHPTYWVTFGQYTPGQVLDIQQITQKAQVAFPVNVYDMYAILGADNKWTVTTQQALNAAYIASGGDAAHALLTDTKLLA